MGLGSHALGCWGTYLEWDGLSQLVEAGAQLLTQAVDGHCRESARPSKSDVGQEDGDPGRSREQHVDVLHNSQEKQAQLIVSPRDRHSGREAPPNHVDEVCPVVEQVAQEPAGREHCTRRPRHVEGGHADGRLDQLEQEDPLQVLGISR